MRKMSSRNSLLTHLLPAGVRCRESHFQYNFNPARCQPTTVSGWARINGCLHPGQRRHNITRNNLSEAANRGCGCRTFKTASCCRRARFSRSKSRRERKKRVARTDKKLSKRCMKPCLHRDRRKLDTQIICLILREVAIFARERGSSIRPRLHDRAYVDLSGPRQPTSLC